MRTYLVAKHTNAFPAELGRTHVVCCAAVGTHGSLQPDCYCAVAGAARGRVGMSEERVFAFRFFLSSCTHNCTTHQAMTTASLVLPNWVSSDVSDVGLFRRCDTTNNATKCADIKPQVSSSMNVCVFPLKSTSLCAITQNVVNKIWLAAGAMLIIGSVFE